MRFIILVLFFSIQIVQSQNLVPNSGFESYNRCPENYTFKYRKELVPGWYLPTGGTADYFNSCTKIQVGVPQNFMGYCLPKEGNAYAGLILMLDPKSKIGNDDYREYLQARLVKALEKDKMYQVSFFAALATNSTYTINRIGACLSSKKIEKRRSTRILDYKPQVELDSLTLVTENDWFCISGIYKAAGGEEYITIGNFYNDKRTSYKQLELTGMSVIKKQQLKQNQQAYYYIDLVSVVEIVDK